MAAMWRGMVLCLVFVAASAAPAPADPVPDAATWTEVTIASADGTKLHADVFRPKGVPEDAEVPVIVNIGPYNGTGPLNHVVGGGGDPAQEGPTFYYKELLTEARLFERGYAWVQADLRGYGGSEGCGDLLGPKERADAKAIVEWVSSQPWSTGRVGMWGGSYEGWGGLAPAAEGAEGVAAVVTIAPVVSLRRALQEHGAGVFYDDAHSTMGLYAALQQDPKSPHATPDQQVANALGLTAAPACFADQLMGVHEQGDTPFWRSRELHDGLAESDVPVLFSHGFLDTTVWPDHMSHTWPVLAPGKRLWVGQFPHGRPYKSVTGRDGFLAEAMRFFDRYVAQVPADRAPVHLDPKVTVQDSDGRWRAETAWPPADARPFELPLKDGTYRAEDRNFGDSTYSGVPVPPSLTGVGVLSATEPLPHAARISGDPQVRATITDAPAGAHLVTLLYDVDPTGSAVLIAEGARPLAGAGEVTVELRPQDWHVPAGHRIALLVAGTDVNRYLPSTAAGDVVVTRGTLTLPVLRGARTQFLEGEAGPYALVRAPIQFDEQRLEAATVDGTPPRAVDPPSGGRQDSRAASCRTRRTAIVRIPRRVRNRRVIGATVAVAGRRSVRVRRGRRSVVIRLRGARTKKVRVRMVLRLAGGERVTRRRALRTCR